MAYPTLNPNEIFAPLFNQIISQEVFSDNLAGGVGSELVDMARVDGSMYGDTKLYYATKPLFSSKWGNDAEATKLLQIARPEAPETQAVLLNQFRQIKLTTDQYLTKRAWGSVDSFSSFNSIMTGWIKDTKRIYDATTYNAFIGTVTSNVGKQTQTINVTQVVGEAKGEEAARLEGAAIGEGVAKLLVNLKDITDEYNDYGILRSYNPKDLIFVWNSDALARVEARDLPTIYHKDIIDRLGEYVLPARYFGDVQTSTVTAANNKAETYPTKFRSLIEKDYGSTHVFPGDEIPYGVEIKANEAYMPNSKIICKVVHNDAIKMMSSFEFGTSFFNPRSLTENHYLIWGYSKPDYLKNYPIVEVVAQ